MTLAERLQLSDVAELPDWAAAAKLNEPDPTLPEVVELRTRGIGPGEVMAALGAEQGAALLDALEAIKGQDSPVRWALRLLDRGALNIGAGETRAQIERLEVAGIITPTQAAALRGLGEHRRFPSWAEHHGVEVTARTVGLARGGI